MLSGVVGSIHLLAACAVAAVVARTARASEIRRVRRITAQARRPHCFRWRASGHRRCMERESATPEELPPLELRKLRELDVEEPSGRGRPAHLSAASGVVRRGDFVYVIGDDELHLGVFQLSSSAPGRLTRVLAGDLPDDHGERSSTKPDLEALTLLPPFEGHPYGALLGLGSGSAPDRDRGFVCRLGADGAIADEPAELDLSPLYRQLREHVGELNVEGAATMG